MPNTFIELSLPETGGVGTPVFVGLTGHPKSFVLSGPVAPGSRFTVEGSNDGGRTWDILLDDDGTQTLFTSPFGGTKTVDCIIEQVRVRGSGTVQSGAPPTITMGAPPAVGRNVFAVLDVPAAPGLGVPLDLGLEVGPLKTFIARGNIRGGSRYTVLASMDGTRFDEVTLFTADRQGARSEEVMCRYLRVHSAGAASPPPTIAVGAEGLAAQGTGQLGSDDLTLSFDETRQVTSPSGEEEVLFQVQAPLSSLVQGALVASLSALYGYDGAAGARFRVRLGGAPGAPDGAEIIVLDVVPPDPPGLAVSAPFAAGNAVTTLVKVTAQGSNAAMRGVVLWFRPATVPVPPP